MYNSTYQCTSNYKNGLIGTNKNSKITIISLSSFIGAFFFIFETKNYVNSFLVAGGILLAVTKIYKLIMTEFKNKI